MRGISVELSDHVNSVLCTSSSTCMLLYSNDAVWSVCKKRCVNYSKTDTGYLSFKNLMAIYRLILT